MAKGWVTGVKGRLVILRGLVEVTGIQPTRRHSIRAANVQNNKIKFLKKSRENLYREVRNRRLER